MKTEGAAAGRPRWAAIRGLRHSIRRRVLAIVLIPSAVLGVTGAVLTGFLAVGAVSDRDWADYQSRIIEPLSQVVDAEHTERAVTLRALGGDQQAVAALPATRKATDTALQTAFTLSAGVAELKPEVTDKTSPAMGDLLGRLPVVRRAVDARQVTAAEVDAFYTDLAGRPFLISMDAIMPIAPDPRTATEEGLTADLFTTADLHLRVVGIAVGAAAHGVLDPVDRLTVARLVGGYRTRLDVLVPRLGDAERAAYQALVGSAEWRLATSGEDSLGLRGVLPVAAGDWLAAEDKVDRVLTGLWQSQFQRAQVAAADTASRSMVRLIVVGVASVVLAVGAFVMALRLANGLVRRLQSLRSKTLELAREKLPSIVRRLHDGEPVDVEAEMVVVDQGADEIGQVAQAFHAAQRTAVEAAASEAKARSGINKVFLDIAHRSQLVVHQQLEVLDVAEAKQNNAEHLELLFKLDHLATRARRNAENLSILGGRQPGRKWRNPVALEELVRSAISETKDFDRVSAVRLPEVRVLGAVVADLMHLLAELVDNATTFSPPGALVSVRGNLVGKGAVVEVEDQGLGIAVEDLRRFNDMLREPPDFQEMALAGQHRLGLFVVGKLAVRHGIKVSLQESVYGGTTAIVLIPSAALESNGAPGGQVPPAEVRTARRPPAFAPETVQDPVPPPPDAGGKPSWQWPVEEEAGEHGARLAARTGTRNRNGTTPVSLPAQPPVSLPGQPPAAGRRRPLPRRSPRTHLAPELQVDEEPPARTGPGTDGPVAPRRLRGADEARSSMSSFQQGTRQARDSSSGHNR
jgi:signal transduction histidine kinase